MLDQQSFVKNNFGNPYWWDTYGQIADEELYLKKKCEYPEYYEAKDFKEQYGKRVFDCSGLIKGYLYTVGEDIDIYSDYLGELNSSELFNLCKMKGDVKDLPEVLGLLLFFPGHVGVYIGGGMAIEARGHDFGVIETKVVDRPWKNWGKLSLISYTNVKSHHTFKVQ